MPLGALVRAMGGSRHERRATGPAKSLSTAEKGCDVRVCGRNELKHHVNGMLIRSIPPSRKSLADTTVLLPAILSRPTPPPNANSTEQTTYRIDAGTCIRSTPAHST